MDLPRIAVEAIRFPDQSVNRGRFSKPQDVLLPCWPRAGIIAYNVEVALYSQVIEKNTVTFGVKHVPKPGNYAHSETYVTKGGRELANDEGKKVPKTAKLAYRERLAANCRIIRPPTPGERFAWVKRMIGRL